MRIEELKEGVYRITRAVTNPAPDRRVKHEWGKLLVWDENTLVVVEDRFSGGRWRIAGSTGGHYQAGVLATMVPDLVAALEPAEDTLAAVLLYYREVASPCALTQDVLPTLLKLGKITLADVREACEVARNEE